MVVRVSHPAWDSPRIWAACAIKCLCARLAGHFRRTPKTKILTSASCRVLWKALLCYIKHDSFLGTATRSGLRAPWARCMPPGEAGIGCAAAWWCSRVLPPPLPAHLASGHSLHSCGAACETGDVFLKNSSGQGVSRAVITFNTYMYVGISYVVHTCTCTCKF